MRIIKKRLESSLGSTKILIIYGARQVGKTTLVRQILDEYPGSRYLNCDEPDIRLALTDKTSTELRSFMGKDKLVVIDEAQRVPNVGLSLKLIHDNFPDLRIIATGSSSFELANRIIEPLTGRKDELYLYPLSIAELDTYYPEMERSRHLEERIIFGMYPEIVTKPENAGSRLKEVAQSYIYRDILQFHGIRKSEAVEKLLQALALQIGNEVSYNELATLVGIDKKTVESYLRILEQSFIVFRLPPLSRNPRKELTKLRKIYFFDTGIRNALIENFNPLSLRQDTGALWENFIISERIKRNRNTGHDCREYFWRTKQGAEIDYVEESGGRLSGFEIKWTKNNFREPKAFGELYQTDPVKLINKDNYRDFL